MPEYWIAPALGIHGNNIVGFARKWERAVSPQAPFERRCLDVEGVWTSCWVGWPSLARWKVADRATRSSGLVKGVC